MHGLILLAQIPFVLRIPELLAEPWFKYLLLPVCGLLAGAVVKGLYRKDDREWTKENFAWEPDLITSACVMMLLANSRPNSHSALICQQLAKSIITQAEVIRSGSQAKFSLVHSRSSLR